MKLTKCSNNHFYDADKSPCCPQCGEYPGAKMKSNQEKPAAAAGEKFVCRDCGMEARPGTKFCVHCGGSVKMVQPKPVAPAAAPAAAPAPAPAKPASAGKMVCATCGKEARPGAKFCIMCGGSLKKAEEKPAAPATDKLACVNCGKEARPGAKFCISCGGQIKPAAPAAAPAPVKPAPDPAKPVCSGCGKEARPGMKFCISCGSPILQPAPVQEDPTEFIFDDEILVGTGEPTVSEDAIPVIAEEARKEPVAVPVVVPAPVIEEVAPVIEEAVPVIEEAAPVVQEAAPVVREEVAPIVRSIPALAEQTCCPSCGLVMRPGSLFCNWCGEEVVFEDEEPVAPAPAPVSVPVEEEPAPVILQEPIPVVIPEPVVVPEPVVIPEAVEEPEPAVSDAEEPEYDEFEDEKTIAIYDPENMEPVVGWLVCVKGAYKGESFELKTRRNTIGRSLKMDIALAKELSVSRDRHAIITYEPIKRKFYIQCGEGSGLTYVNNEVLMTPREIVDYDLIRMGNCKLILRTLCNGEFSWNDGE